MNGRRDARQASSAGAADGLRAMLRTVLVHVGGDAEDLPRLRAAAALARRFDATLYGVGCEQAPPLGVSDPTGLAECAWYAEMQEEVQVDLQRARSAFQSETAGLETQWTEVEEMPVDALSRLSRSADLIVCDRRRSRGDDPHRAADAIELMFCAGRPILLVPPSGGELKAAAVVVAWKDTREARRALSDALPLLAGAETVLVMETCSDGNAARAEESTSAVAAGLRRHGVTARTRVVAAPAERIMTELDGAAQAIGADLIVAGGYGHSRFGEWIFGGVTRDLLHYCDRFVLLSH